MHVVGLVVFCVVHTQLPIYTVLQVAHEQNCLYEFVSAQELCLLRFLQRSPVGTHNISQESSISDHEVLSIAPGLGDVEEQQLGHH